MLQNTSFIVGIIIAVICSNWVGEAIHSDGIYETDLEADGSVIFLRPSPPQGLNTKKAIDIACKAVWYASRTLSVPRQTCHDLQRCALQLDTRATGAAASHCCCNLGRG